MNTVPGLMLYLKGWPRFKSGEGKSVGRAVAALVRARPDWFWEISRVLTNAATVFTAGRGLPALPLTSLRFENGFHPCHIGGHVDPDAFVIHLDHANGDAVFEGAELFQLLGILQWGDGELHQAQ